MNKLFLVACALIGGFLLALQGGINARLGVLLKNPLLASFVAFTSSALIATCVIALTVRELPTSQALKQIPYYFWFLGGLCSVSGLVLYYYTIPRLGIATMISLGLSGQLIFAVVAGHFGWFKFPVQPIDTTRIVGVILMLIAIIMINKK